MTLITNIVDISSVMYMYGILYTFVVAAFVSLISVSKDEDKEEMQEKEEINKEYQKTILAHKYIGEVQWSRINGRMKKRFILVDLDNKNEDDNYDLDYTEKDLDEVKKNLIFDFNKVHDVFKHKIWYRKNGRLMRI
jgi:hypothetical protein